MEREREREREIPTVLGTYVLYLELYASGAKTKQKGGYILGCGRE